MRTKTLAVCTAMLALCAPLAGQWLNHPTAGVPMGKDGRPNLLAAVPRTADGRPDLSGIWRTRTVEVPGLEPLTEPVAGSYVFPPEFGNIAARLKGGLPFRPWALQLWQARQENLRVDSPAGKCKPVGILQRHTNPLPKKLIQVPGLLVILDEEQNEFRQIFTDGRSAPVDPLPSFNGYSMGKWDGDTLVVRSVGFKEEWWADRRGTPLTDAATVTERFRRVNYGNMEIEITVDDPKAYAQPWSVALHQDIVLDTELMEYFCNENEKDRDHLVGK
jgi:hypothetical protein